MPNRIIKESICTSESLNELSDFEENLFYKLVVNCDDYGRFDGRASIIKARCYPLRERLTLKNVNDALLQLARVGCVKLYDVDGKPFLFLPSWEVPQQVRAKKSKFPAPDSNGYQMISDDSKCPRNPIQSESESESGSESKHAPEQARGDSDPLDGYDFGEGLKTAVMSWLAYKSEKGQKYKPVGLNSLLKKILDMAGQHGEEAVSKLIDESMACNYQGIVWDKIKDRVKVFGGASAAKGSTGNIFLDRLAERRAKRESVVSEQ